MKAFDVVIVGAGPAGIAAAIAAREARASVAVIDHNPDIGGQIWRRKLPDIWLRRFSECKAELLLGTRAINVLPSESCLVAESSQPLQISYSKLILATGARELFLPFPGWTLPNIFGVGGLQAIVKSGLSVRGKRIIVAGSGPLLLAVAAYLTRCGARVPIIAEQASRSDLMRFSTRLVRYPRKIREAISFKSAISGTSYLPGCWVTSASGGNRIEELTLIHNGRRRHEIADYLAISYGFVPNTELAQLLGCQLEGDFVAVDDHQQTSVANVLCAGEPTGLGGSDKSLLEGEIAGRAATNRYVDCNRRKVYHFTRTLHQAFVLRSELRSLPKDDTVICRCEDVTFGQLRNASSWREAKLHHRCGMGPCQGRICGPITGFLFGWKQDSVRPPIFSTPVQNLIQFRETVST